MFALRKGAPLLTACIRAAMARATCKRLAEGGRFFCEIPELQGVWADAATPEAGLIELQEVLEDWIALGLTIGGGPAAVETAALRRDLSRRRPPPRSLAPQSALPPVR